MSIKYCSHCGQKVGVEASFCNNCGTKLTTDAPDPTMQDHEPNHISDSGDISRKHKHSWFGITSLILGVITAAIQFVAILGAGIAVGGSNADANQSVLAVIGMFICGGIAFHVLGMILGIIGLAQPKHKNLFPILGVVINAVSFLAVIGLIIIGNSIPG